MGMQVNTNLAALNGHRNLSNTQNDLSKSLEKLSSGLRINRAADDAAGLAISEGLRSQVNGMTVAARNAQDGISVVQTAEGALGEVQSILQRMRDLAVQGSNDSNNDDSRAAIQKEAVHLSAELSRISETTNFNGINLFQAGGLDAASGKGPAKLTFQVGADGNDASQIALTMTSMQDMLDDGTTKLVTLTSGTPLDAGDPTAVAAGVTGFNVGTNADAQATIELIDNAIKEVSASRADLGAVQNRFESAVNSLNVGRENLTAAESRIRDVDMAAEMVSFTRANIMSQAGTAMLAQANQSNQGVLQLLG